MTAIGDLRHRITFQSLALADDGIGGHTQTWTDLVTVWASVEPVSGAERLFSERLEDIYTHKIRIRKRTDITSTMRIVFQTTRIFQVKELRADKERKDFMTVMAIEGVGT